jgi:hypothetical protein
MRTLFPYHFFASFLKSIVVVALVVLITPAHAEYYYSYAPCGEEVITRYSCKAKVSRPHHPVKHKRHVVHHPKRSHYTLEVYYVWPTFPSCWQPACYVPVDCCYERRVVKVRRPDNYVVFSAEPVAYDGFVDLENDPYNPDMRTADDVSSDPVMNDNY